MSDPYYLPEKYVSRDKPRYHDDIELADSGQLWQPQVYELANTITAIRGVETVIDLGCGNGLKLQKVLATRRIGVDFGANLEWCRKTHQWGEWIEHDLEAPDHHAIVREIGLHTLVICADVIEHLRNPLSLVALWRAAYEAGAFLITSTPDRVLNRGSQHVGPPDNPAHVREWNLEEYIAFLINQRLPITAAGWTINNNVDEQASTIITIHDGSETHRLGTGGLPLRFNQLGPWLDGLKKVGAVARDLKSMSQAGTTLVNFRDHGTDKSETHSAPSLVTETQANRTEPQIPANQSGGIFERMILLATESAAASVRLQTSLTQLRAAEDARAAAVGVIEQLRAKLDAKADALRAAEDGRGADAAVIEQLRGDLDAKADALRAAEDGRAADTAVIEQLRGDLGAKADALRVAEDARAADADVIERLRADLGAKADALRASEDARGSAEVLITQLHQKLSETTRRLRSSPDCLRDDLIVCMLFFNKLEQTIESAESFVRAGIRVHLLNNGSAAEAAKKLRSHFFNNSLVDLADAGSNKGISAGRNLQIKLTKQPWLIFADNDIRLEQANLVTELAASIAARPNVEIFVPRLFNQHEDAWVPLSNFTVDEHGNCAFVQSDTPFSNSFPGGASIVSRRVFDRLGLYDEDLFVGFEDFELAIRAWKQGQPLLVSPLDKVSFIHDHRNSELKVDKASSRVRYDVGSITDSHSIIQRKHGIRLDPNFATWLTQQIRQLSGEEVGSEAGAAPAPVEEHVLLGTTVTPRWCGPGRLIVLIDGEGVDCWLRLRAARIAANAASQAAVGVTLVLVGGDVDLAQRAVENGLIDRATSMNGLGQSDLISACRSTIGVCWYLRGLMTPEFLVKGAQMLIHDGSMREAFIHPERVVLATAAGQGLQYVRRGWFDPLEAEHNERLYPLFIMPASTQELITHARVVREPASFADRAMALIARHSGRPHRHFGLSGSAAVVRVEKEYCA